MKVAVLAAKQPRGLPDRPKGLAEGLLELPAGRGRRDGIGGRWRVRAKIGGNRFIGRAQDQTNAQRPRQLRKPLRSIMSAGVEAGSEKRKLVLRKITSPRVYADSRQRPHPARFASPTSPASGRGKGPALKPLPLAGRGRDRAAGEERVRAGSRFPLEAQTRRDRILHASRVAEDIAVPKAQHFITLRS